jgi:hypothetical protein
LLEQFKDTPETAKRGYAKSGVQGLMFDKQRYGAEQYPKDKKNRP